MMSALNLGGAGRADAGGLVQAPRSPLPVVEEFMACLSRLID
jgi:hypothetical protein